MKCTMKEIEMKIDLEQNEIEFILNVLGEMPTKSNAFVVVQKIQQQLAQASEQVMQQQPEPKAAE